MGRVRVRLRVCTSPTSTRDLTFLRVISITLARAFAEGVIVRVRVRARVVVRLRVFLGLR
jgi:hypothetical protein